MAAVITYHRDMIQGTDEWLAARCGLLTASEMALIVTPTGKVADNDKARGHLCEMLAQRITRHVEPRYMNDDMLRGHEDEVDARDLYSRTYAPVAECGFVTNDQWGFTLGCSPDGLVGDDGMIEIKSRRARYQVDTILNGTVPAEYVMQIQTALMVTQRQWCDFISYSGGLPMVTIRVYPDAEIEERIVKAAASFEARLEGALAKYREQLATLRTMPTARRIEQEMVI